MPSAATIAFLTEVRCALGRDIDKPDKVREYIIGRAEAKRLRRLKEDRQREASRARRAAISSGERDGMTCEVLSSGGVVSTPGAAPGGPDSEDLETGERFYSREGVAAHLGMDLRNVQTLMARRGYNPLVAEKRGTRAFISVAEMARWEAAEAASALSEGQDTLDSSSDIGEERAA